VEALRWQAALDGDLDTLEQTRRRHLAMGRPVQALCDDEAATLSAAGSNRIGDARRLLDRLTRDADALGSPGIADRAERGARTLGLHVTPRQRSVRPVSGWGALTGTERAVARLVGDGRSNVQVAHELGISRRTVESHLYRTFAKLGVRNRTELALAIRNDPEPPQPPPHDR
jgi:DNA-binding CsgD family transcriptional regulator